MSPLNTSPWGGSRKEPRPGTAALPDSWRWACRGLTGRSNAGGQKAAFSLVRSRKWGSGLKAGLLKCLAVRGGALAAVGAFGSSPRRVWGRRYRREPRAPRGCCWQHLRRLCPVSALRAAGRPELPVPGGGAAVAAGAAEPCSVPHHSSCWIAKERGRPDGRENGCLEGQRWANSRGG